MGDAEFGQEPGGIEEAENVIDSICKAPNAEQCGVHSSPPVKRVGEGGTGYGWNDGSGSAATILTSDADLSRILTSDLVHVWCMMSTAIIRHQEPPRPLEQVQIWELLGLRPGDSC